MWTDGQHGRGAVEQPDAADEVRASPAEARPSQLIRVFDGRKARRVEVGRVYSWTRTTVMRTVAAWAVTLLLHAGAALLLYVSPAIGEQELPELPIGGCIFAGYEDGPLDLPSRLNRATEHEVLDLLGDRGFDCTGPPVGARKCIRYTYPSGGAITLLIRKGRVTKLWLGTEARNPDACAHVSQCEARHLGKRDAVEQPDAADEVGARSEAGWRRPRS